MPLMQHLVELRIHAHEGPMGGRESARLEYERLLKLQIKDKPHLSWQDLDIALREPYRKALRERDRRS